MSASRFLTLTKLIQYHRQAHGCVRWCPEIEERLKLPRPVWMTPARAQEDLDEALEWSFEDPRLMCALLKAGARPKPIHLLQTLGGYSHWPEECQQDMLPTVDLMIKAGADAKVLRRLSGDYYPKLAVSLLQDVLCRCESWAEPLARLLLKNGARVDAVAEADPPVWEAIKQETVWPFALLLEHGVDLSVVSAQAWETASKPVQAWRRAQQLEVDLGPGPAVSKPRKPRM